MAHEANDEEYTKFWQLAANIYAGYSLYKQRDGSRHIPVMVLEPDRD